MNNEQTTDELLKTALTALAVIVIISFGAMRLCAWGEAPLGYNPSNEAVQPAISAELALNHLPAPAHEIAHGSRALASERHPALSRAVS
jgi:hypothetical protein